MIVEVDRRGITIYCRGETLRVKMSGGKLQVEEATPREASATLRDDRTLVVECSGCRVIVSVEDEAEAPPCVTWSPKAVEVALDAGDCRGISVEERMVIDVGSGEVLRDGSNLHIFNLDETWLMHVLGGRKTVEGRLYDLKRRRVRPGHYILFKCDDRRVYVKVVGVRVYPDFKSMLEWEGVERVLPGVRSMEEAVSIYRGYYSEAEEKRFGVVAIEISLDWGCSRSSP